MALKDRKITEAGIAQHGVISAPDRLTGTAAENKKVFDKLVRNVVAEQLNGLVDDLSSKAAGASGISQLGMTPIAGLSAANAQAALEELKAWLEQAIIGAGGVLYFNGRKGAVVPQSGDYTAAMVGAAPAGYGLGDVGGTDLKDCNDAVANGWYDCGNKTANIPSGFTGHGTLAVGSRGGDKFQLYFPAFTNPKSVLMRWCRNGAWDEEWEWVNPPMLAGQEYRTTERYNGKPVYAQLFEIDSLPNAKWQDYLFDDTKNQGCNDVVSFSCYTSNRKTIPTMSHGSGAIDLTDAIDIVVQADPNTGIRIIVITTRDRSSVSAKVLVKYTKS